MKKELKYNIFVIFLLVIAFIPSHIISNNMMSSSHFNPETSSSPITINSPEEKIYGKPQKGYYPATYGFENQDAGDSGLEIDFIDDVSTYGTCEIAESYTDNQNNIHKKVLHVEDSLTYTGMKFRHSLDNVKTSGTIEFWFVMTDEYQGLDDRVLFYSMKNSVIGFSLTMEDGAFIDSQSNRAVMKYNCWNHIRITFDCSEGVNGQYDWYINNSLQYSGVEMENSISNIDELCIRGHTGTRGEAYFDAFGFSWSSSYTILNNLKEGLLLDFDPDNLTQMWYVLDNYDPVYILGSTVIPMPSYGSHSIQVFGSGDYESDQIDFTSYVIEINSPQGSYSGPMSGYYPASYGFEHQEDEDSGLEIDFIDDVSTYGTCEIAESYTDDQNNVHKKVLHVEDSLTYTGMKFTHSLPVPKTAGQIEFWFLMTDKYEGLNDRVLFYTSNSTGEIGFRLTMEDEKIIDSQSNSVNIEYDTWYRIGINFKTYGEYEFDWYLDGKLQYYDVEMENSIDSVDYVYLRGHAATRGEAYFDAFGFSWEGYNFGDNHKEGLLLDIERNDIDELEYAIDGEDPIPIPGDIVIPFPFTRYHTLKVFGRYGATEIESNTCIFSFGSLNVNDDSYVNKFAFIFYAADVYGGWVEEYKQILKEYEFNPIIIDCQVGHSEFESHVSQVDTIEDEDDIILCYMHGHGVWFLGNSHICLVSPLLTWFTSSYIRSLMDNFESQRKMVYASSCYSGGFVTDLNAVPYIVMSESSYDREGVVFGSTSGTNYVHEGIVSDQFFDKIKEGYNSYYSYYFAEFVNRNYQQYTNPRFADNCDIHFFGY